MHIVTGRPAVPDFQDFYRDNYLRVVSYITGKIGSPTDAEDLASEVFLYCYNHYSEFDPEKSAITTWLYLIVNSRIKNHYRDSRCHVDLEEVAGVLSEEVDMDKAIWLEQVRAMLEKALRSLPPRQRQIVELRYFEDKNSTEIASILGMSPVNVRVQLSRALAALEKTCGNFFERD